MKRPSPLRLLPLFLVFLLFIAGTIARDDPSPENVDDSHSSEPPRNEPGPGAYKFDEASDLLRQIKPTATRLSSYNKKPTGMLANIVYYGKELFYILFMTSQEQELSTSMPQQKKLSKPLSQAVKLLEESATDRNPDAIYLLAEMNFFGNYSHPRNYSEAFKRYSDLALLNGNSSAQHMLGFMYATGIGSAVKEDQAKALLYHTSAAEAGDIRSQMTVAFRHHTGIGTPRSCGDAVHYYKQVADKAIAYFRSGPPGGYHMPKKSYRIADDDGGVYGEGASVSSSGPNAKTGGVNSDAYAAFEDVLEYLELMHRKGDLKATFSLGQLYYDGSRQLKQDFPTAKRFFYDVARTHWGKDGKLKADIPPGTEKLASKSAGHIGRMWLRGEGVVANYEIAQTWFKRGVANGDGLCQYHMGLMYMLGLGVEPDGVKAAEYFASAADQDLAAAQVKLGALFLDQGDVQIAAKYFDLASRNGHIEAYYYLADLANQGLGRDKSCGVAVLYYKIVAEKAEMILSSFVEANAALENGDTETALIDYMLAAEQGFEHGQSNVAYLLDQARPRLLWESLLPFGKKKPAVNGDDGLALLYWTRSARQMNIDSLVKMGDYYLEGRGAPTDAEKAAACYQSAAETLQCAQAMWNLGWMHENGIGMEQDFHLAKRYYDMALETNPREAYLPVTLALYKLRMRSWWNDMIGDGKIKSIQDEPEPTKEFSFAEWLANFLENGDAYYDNEELYGGPDDWETGAGGGAATGGGGRGGGHEHMPGGDDFYGDDIDDGILESLLIVSLGALLAFLVYYRQQRQLQERRRREEERRMGGAGPGAADQRREGDRGLFPVVDDPEFMNWVAGGVGH